MSHKVGQSTKERTGLGGTAARQEQVQKRLGNRLISEQPRVGTIRRGGQGTRESSGLGNKLSAERLLNGGGRERVPAAGYLPQAQDLFRYLIPRGSTVDRPEVSEMRSFAQRRMRENGNPHGFTDAQIVNRGVLNAQEFRTTAGNTNLLRGVEIPAEMALKAAIITITKPVNPDPTK